MMNMQDLYLSIVNLRMNEVMKVMAVVTCLLAPATVIGGIFGMNFDIIPLLHKKWGGFISRINAFCTFADGALFLKNGAIFSFYNPFLTKIFIKIIFFILSKSVH